jgi:hypothetical protein
MRHLPVSIEQSHPSSTTGMSDEKKPFKVTDRRHFTADGRVRDEEDEQQPEASGKPPAPAPTSAPSSMPPPAAVQTAPPTPHERRHAADEPPVEFGGFIVSLASQAGFLLEAGTTPEGERIPPDLDGARQIIAILEMLKTKTEGRRTPEEDRILDGVLYELRLGYVARAGVVGA